MREAIATLDVVVAIDVFMTETARLADYVLPRRRSSRSTSHLLHFEFPRTCSIPPTAPDAAAGPCPSPKSRAPRRSRGVFKDAELEPLRAAARRGRREFAAAFAEATKANPRLGSVAPVVLTHARRNASNGATAAAALCPCASLREDES